jgi:hypothetical protein
VKPLSTVSELKGLRKINECGKTKIAGKLLIWVMYRGTRESEQYLCETMHVGMMARGFNTQQVGNAIKFKWPLYD